MGEKQKAIDFYALTIATNHAPPETRARLETLLGSNARADEAAKSAFEILGKQRTVQLPRLTKGLATAEFFVLFGQGQGTMGAKFISGSDELRGSGKALSSASFDVAFPDDHPVKVVRRGILDCPATGTHCLFVMFPPENSIQ
jgi:hypothetical protein